MLIDDVSGLDPRRGETFLRMDRLEHPRHFLHLGIRYVAEHVAVEVHHAALPLGLGEVVVDRLLQSQAGIGDDQLHAGQAALC